MSLTFPVDAKLKDGSPVQLVLAGDRYVDPLRDLYRIIVEEGTSYPHDRFPDEDGFMDYWFRGKSTVAAYVPDRAHAAGMVGAFYLKPNWPGLAWPGLAWAGGACGECRLYCSAGLAQQRLGTAVGRDDVGLCQAARLP